MAGGRRPGSGRKAGGRNRITREAVEKAKAGGAMPLDIILKQMRKYDAAADKLERSDNPDPKAILEAEALALERAKEAAPYLHPKLQSITQKNEPIDLSKLPRDVIEQLIAAAESLERARAGETTH